jgi:hypothetical protein
MVCNLESTWSNRALRIVAGRVGKIDDIAGFNLEATSSGLQIYQNAQCQLNNDRIILYLGPGREDVSNEVNRSNSGASSKMFIRDSKADGGTKG